MAEQTNKPQQGQTALGRKDNEDQMIRMRAELREKVESDLRAELTDSIRAKITEEVRSEVIRVEHDRQKQEVLRTLNGIAPHLRHLLKLGNSILNINDPEFGEIVRKHTNVCPTDDGNGVTFMGVIATIGRCCFGDALVGLLNDRGGFGGWKFKVMPTLRKQYKAKPEDIVNANLPGG